MATRVYIQSNKNAKVRYNLKSFNAETKTAILFSGYADGTFELKPFTKERLEKDGYELRTEEVEDAKPQWVSP